MYVRFSAADFVDERARGVDDALLQEAMCERLDFRCEQR